MTTIERYYISLGIDLNDLAHPISKMINNLNSKNDINRKLDEHFLRLLGLALMKIKEYDKRIFKKYKNRINTQKESFFGHVFEIMQCYHFISMSEKTSLSFKFGDANKNEPDFFFNNFGFEITTSRFSDDSENHEPGKKLLFAFRDKNKKTYADNNTALLVDMTNISEKAFGKKVNMSLDDFGKIIENESKFGVSIFFTEWLDHEKFTTALIVSKIIFSNSCNPTLKEMLEKLFFHENTLTNDNSTMLKK